MPISQHIFRLMLPALLWGTVEANAAGIAGVFDAGWTTANQSQDSITHMHQRLHALGMDHVVLQYAAVEATHLYYPSELDFLQDTPSKDNQLFPKSIEAAKTAGTKLWLGLYYNDLEWFASSILNLYTLSQKIKQVIDELHSLYGNESVIEGVYIPQEIARSYWNAKDIAKVMRIVTKAAQEKGWKIMTAPFYNQNLDTPEELQTFFEELFEAEFKPDIIAVQDGIGASNPDYTPHAEIETVGNYERALAQACKKYNIEFWVDMELFRTDDSHALADKARLSAQLDTAYAAGAEKVIAYDLSVLGNAGLDSLEKWKLGKGSGTAAIAKRRAPKTNAQPGTHKYYKPDGARALPGQRVKKFLK